MDREYDSAGHMSLLRQMRISQGLCPNCGEHNDQDHYYCSKCELMKEDYDRRYHKSKKNQKICARCLGELDRDGLYCSKCLPIVNASTNLYKKRYLDQGLCPRCKEHNQVVTGLKYCQDCRDKQTSERRLRYKLFGKKGVRR